MDTEWAVASRSPHPLDRSDVPYGETPLVVAKGTSLPATEMQTGFLRSMFANWAGEAVIVVSGFILPRLISQGMGQEQLGIWDYGWSMRAYVWLAGSALGSGAGHYVARYRASEQCSELARTLGAMLALVIY